MTRTISWAEIAKLHVWTLPRWFALPVSTSAIVLGGLVSGASACQLAAAAAIGACLMAWAHTMNTWADWVLTGFDKGESSERSRPKPYTAGQNVIAEGWKPVHVLAVGLFWLWLGLFGAAVLSVSVGLLVMLPVLVSVPITFLYSYGKRFYLCEVALGLAFGPVAAMLGAAVADDPRLWQAFLAGIPIGVMFGFAAEAYDQWYDAEHNWERGLRNIGAWTWKVGGDIRWVVWALGGLALIAMTALVAAGVLQKAVLLAAVAWAPLALMWLWERESKRAIAAGLAAVFLFSVLMVVGEAL